MHIHAHLGVNAAFVAIDLHESRGALDKIAPV